MERRTMQEEKQHKSHKKAKSASCRIESIFDRSSNWFYIDFEYVHIELLIETNSMMSATTMKTITCNIQFQEEAQELIVSQIF